MRNLKDFTWVEKQSKFLDLFSVRGITAFLHVEMLDNITVLHLEAILNSKIVNKKHEDAKTWHKTNHERILVYRMEDKARRQSLLLLPQLGMCVDSDLTFSPLCSCLQITAKVPQVQIFRLQINFRRVGKFTNMKSSNNED